MAEMSGSPRGAGGGRMALALTAFVVVGSVMVYWVWEGVNEILAGELRPRHLLIGVVMLAALIMLLRLLSRYLRRVESDASHPASGSGGS